jgi:hypothetical protein
MSAGPVTDAQANEHTKFDTVLAHLAVEYWKLLRSFEKAREMVPPDAKVRLSAQGRYAAGRLEALLSDAKMRLMSFDGILFEMNLPAIAINGEDVSGLEGAIVERTIEPAVLSGMTVILMGKVFLAQPAQRGDGQNVPGH